MLTRLELLGFKSFADRTRFDFAPGVTAVVGPNGSGKSNVVDAVRWLLGEQSAKALRGAEMTDVIFNGSSTRKSLGMAEVTMSFDNSAKLLDHPADAVTVTRRVYRDGRGEYLVNGDEVRLKDIRDLFLGSGAGHGAYSVIEQGKVDALLTSSAKDRRLIFEEAAGISRFKAKKLETLRKLDRVDADLIRVHDILRELDTQLRGLRLQAAKAEKYREYRAAEQALRVSVGLRDFRRLSAALDTENAALKQLRAELAATAGGSEVGEADLKRLDWEAARTLEALGHQQSRLAAAREAVVTLEAAAKAGRQQLAQHDSDLLQAGVRRAALGRRLQALDADAARHRGESQSLEKAAAAEAARSAGLGEAVEAAGARLAELGEAIDAERGRQFNAVGREARAASDAESARGHFERLQREGERKAAEATAVRRRHAELHDLLAGLSQSDADLKERHAESQATHRRLLTERDTLAARLATSRSRLETLREGRSGLRARAEVLEGWEASREGFGAGVREVLARIDAGDPLLSGAVVGLVGDLVRAPREVAALVDVALGDAAQRLVVAAEADAAALADALATVTGRVGFLPLSDTAASPPPPHGTGPPPLPLSALVQCDRPGLAAQLLGNTFVVGTLADALAHAARQPWCRFVTPRGELLDADGSVTVGPALAGVGILSRKSELRELRGQLAALEATIAGGEGTHRGLTESADKLAANIDSLERELNALSGEAGTLRERIAEQRQVEQQLAERLELLAEEGVTGAAERTRAEATAERLRAEAEAAAGAVRAVNARLEAFVADHAAAEAEREGRVADHAAARVAVGQLTEQVSAARRRATELDAERRQRKVDGVNLAAEARALTAKRLDALLSVLRATQDAATHFADKEARERLCRDLAARRDAVEAARSALVTALKDSQSVARGHQDEAHRRELAVRDLLNERDGVTGKLRDDFGVDLRGLADSGAEPGQLPADPAAEIDALRKSVARLGAVNVESIAELAALEARETELRSQFDDLSNGRTALQAIIDQINGDSRRLFADLLTAVRGHFQELFRKVFAGGRADIVLDDEADVLESGIEIVAHPPGKQAQNLSLLSGGERALTAAALLLAIFRSKPSPFCLLDEIDAAMDEANTARLADLVREFSTRTQFIVITHKKRTMAAADVLHGVTMQESGVSKLVAVRFEDWPEDSDEAPRRAA